MDRRQLAEENYRQKFETLGLTGRFEFIRREWSANHDSRFWARCKSCGTEFLSYPEIFKGRANHLLCPECGAASDGVDIWARSPKCDEAMAFYTAGHSVRETAEKFGVSIYQINNAVKRRRLTNGKNWQQGGFESNEHRHNEAVKRLNKYIEDGGRDFTKVKGTHRKRAVKYGCKYDDSITLEKLIERDGLRCAICGELCNLNDKTWKHYGPTSPTIDHIIPMSKGGGHIWENIQIAHAFCNSKKRDIYEED